MATSSLPGVDNTGQAPQSDAPMGSSKLGKDEFLKLLMAQLAHQDPMSPMDSQAFVAQLAQFANVEQLQSANSSLESLLLAQTSNNQTAVTNLVGKDAVFRTDALRLTETEAASTHITLPQGAANVSAVISDANGKVVRTLQLGAHPQGEVTINWDGRDDAGVRLAAGEYKVKVAAADASGKSLSVDAKGHARISAVSFANGYPELLANGTRIKMADIVEISEPQ